MVVELRNRLEARLGLTLSATLVWKYPTIAVLASYLADRLGTPLSEAPVHTTAPPPEVDRTAGKREQLKSLSDDELAALMAAKLATLRRTVPGGAG
jgi:hypothetical protein